MATDWDRVERTCFAFDLTDAVLGGFQRVGDELSGLAPQLGRFVRRVLVVVVAAAATLPLLLLLLVVAAAATAAAVAAARFVAVSMRALL